MGGGGDQPRKVNIKSLKLNIKSVKYYIKSAKISKFHHPITRKKFNLENS